MWSEQDATRWNTKKQKKENKDISTVLFALESFLYLFALVFFLFVFITSNTWVNSVDSAYLILQYK